MKKPIIIAFGNRKGGVAKTTTVSSLAGYFTKRGFRVLAVDLDTQANLTTTFLKDIPDDTVTDIFDKKRIPIHHIRENLDLVAADADLVAVERILNRPDDRLILARALAVVKDKYDIILLDCPPSLSWLTINALSASDKLFVPMDMDKKSVDAVSKMAEVCYQSATPTKIDGIFFTKYEPRLNATKSASAPRSRRARWRTRTWSPSPPTATRRRITSASATRFSASQESWTGTGAKKHSINVSRYHFSKESCVAK